MTSSIRREILSQKEREPMPKHISARTGLVSTIVVVVVGLAATLAVAAIPAKSGVITGCYVKQTGALRVVAKAADCKHGQKVLHWNAKGAPGSKGATGKPGLNGHSILSGTGSPSHSLGSNGDFYLDTASNSIYGPKANGTWPTPGTSLVGPKGDNGPGTFLMSASGSPATITTTAAGTPASDAVLPLSGVGVTTGVEDASTLDAASLTPDLAQTFPQNGTLTAITAQLTTTTNDTAGVFTSYSFTATLWTSTSDPNTLSPVSGATCTMPLGGLSIAPAETSCQATGLSIPITSATSGVIVISGADAGSFMASTGALISVSLSID